MSSAGPALGVGLGVWDKSKKTKIFIKSLLCSFFSVLEKGQQVREESEKRLGYIYPEFYSTMIPIFIYK